MSNYTRRARRKLAVSLTMLASAALPALPRIAPAATNTTDTFTSGTALDDPNDWSTGTVPGIANDALIGTGYPTGSDTLTLGSLSSSLTFGSFDDTNTSGTITLQSTQTSSTLTLGGSGDLGNGVSGAASTDLLYVAAGASLNINNGSDGSTLTLALGQSGTFDIAGTATANIGASISGAFTLTKTGAGALSLNGSNSFTGLTVSSGTLNLTGSLTQGGSTAVNVATASGNNAVVNISGSLQAFDLFVGGGGTGTAGTGGAGAVYQTGGSVTLTDTTAASGTTGPDRIFTLGGVGSEGTNGYGYYNLSGGSLSAKQFDIGARSTGAIGIMDMSGGTMTASAQISLARGNSTSVATYGLLNVTGGQVYYGSSSTTPVFQMGFVPGFTVLDVGGGTGQATVAAGSNSAGSFNLATLATAGTSAVNLLANGELTVPSITASSATNSSFVNFNGGTLQATSPNAGATFLTSANIAAVNVYAAGGTIDNNGTSITISKVLAAPAGNGVATIPISTGGAGYVGPPAVVITGGAGAGATAYAIVSNGQVTGIVITSPGTGYTSAPTVTLLGGGASTAATLGAITLNSGNTSGGMTFQGGGTTKLTSASTYTGTTNVSYGLLNLTGSLASPLTILPGGTFTGSGNGSTTGLIGGAVNLNPSGAIDFSKDGLTAPTTLTLGNGLTIGSTSGPAASLTYNITNSATDLLSLTGGSLNVFAASGSPNVINLNPLSTFAASPTTFNLITFPAGQTNLTAANLNQLFTIGTQPSGLLSFALSVTSTALQLTETTTAVPITAYWTGKYDNTWADFNATGPVTNFSSTADGKTDTKQLPGTATDVVFTAASNGNATSLSGAAVTTSLGQAFTIDSLTFNATPASVTISDGSNALTINASGSATGTGSLGYAAGTGIVVQSGAGPVTIATAGLVLGGAQTWSNASTNPLTVSAPISGAAALTINNTGTDATVLSGSNTFTGGLTLSSGLLQMSGSGTLGASGNALAVNGGTLDLNGTQQSVGNLSGTGGTITNSSNGGATLTIGNGNGTGGNYSGSITDNSANGAGTVTVIKTGTGAITLSGNNTYNGGTQVSGGMLQATTPAALPQYGTFAAVSVSNGGILAINYGGPSDWNTTQASMLLANLSSTGGVIGFDTTNGSAAYPNAITDSNYGALGLAKLGPNALTLSGASTYSGTTTINDGTVNLTGSIVQTSPNSLSLATVSTNAVLNIGGNLTVLNMAVGGGGTGTAGTGAAGAIYQTAGTVTLTDTTSSAGATGPDRIFSLGAAGSTGTNGYGYYNLSGASSALTAKQLDPGARSTGAIGVMDVTAGTVTATSDINIARGNATTGGCTGVLNVTGGTINAPLVQMGFVPGGLSIFNIGGGSGPATLTQTASATAGGIDLANASNGASAMLNLLTNGIASVPRVFATTASAPGTFVNFNGGTLQAAATNFGASFLSSANIAAVTVYSAGGTIDNNGTSITVGNALLAPAGDGVSSIPVSSAGSGYIGAPAVSITGGGGTGATAYATISNGQLSGIVITSPGTGYTSAPTVTLLGGGTSTPATLGNAVLNSGNISGGMNFVGSGTTILSGANTYTGSTAISAGTLEVDGSLGNTAVAVAPGATLSGKGAINNAGSNAITINGTIAPGTPTVTANLTSTGTMVWPSNGTYAWKLNLASPTSGSTVTDSHGTLYTDKTGANWDQLTLSSLSASSGFSIQVIGLTPSGQTSAFNESQSYQWVAANVPAGTAPTNVNFVLPPPTGFSGDSSFGVFSAMLEPATTTGDSTDDLVILYTPSPEPSALALSGLAAGGLLLRRRRGRSGSAQS